jgi:hypothetical protein
MLADVERKEEGEVTSVDSRGSRAVIRGEGEKGPR